MSLRTGNPSVHDQDNSSSSYEVRPDRAETVLSVHQLSYRFNRDVPLFCDLSFHIQEGEFVTFLAPSGLGKTTLFRLIAGLLTPDSGSVVLAQGSSRREDGIGAGKASIGYMPQRDCLLPWRTVLDNAALGLEIAGVPKREAQRRVMELLPHFGLEGTAKHMPAELSGGMRQRVSFLRTMLTGGRMLLLDEPFSALDAMTRLGMQEWLLEVWERYKTTVLFITHDIDEAILLSDRILVAYETPITRLASFEVPIPRPRTFEDTLETPVFNETKKEILRLLRSYSQLGGPRS